MIIKSKIYEGLSFEIQDCAPSELVPVFEIDLGTSPGTGYNFGKRYVYRYNGKLWAIHPAEGSALLSVVQQFERTTCVTKSLQKKAIENWLVSGDMLYIPATEPFYYLDTNGSTANSIVKVAYDDTGFMEYRRRYAHNERDKAVAAAEEIIRLVYNEKRDSAEKWPAVIIHRMESPEHSLSAPSHA